MFGSEYMEVSEGDHELMITACLSVLKLVFGDENWRRFNKMKVETNTDTVQSLFTWLMDVAEDQINSQDEAYLAAPVNHGDVEAGIVMKTQQTITAAAAGCDDGEDDDVCILKQELPDSQRIQQQWPTTLPTAAAASYDHTAGGSALEAGTGGEPIVFTSDTNSFYCNLCQVNLSDVEVVREHAKLRHTDYMAQGSVEPGGSLVIGCTCCAQRFPSLDDYVSYHTQMAFLSAGAAGASRGRVDGGDSSQSRASKHICTYCAKQFTMRQTLQEHVANIHDKAEPSFGCAACGKKFKYSRSLRGHKKKCGAVSGVGGGDPAAADQLLQQQDYHT